MARRDHCIPTKTIGQIIRTKRRLRGLTQWELSQMVGIRPGTILLIERGQLTCSRAVIQKIAMALGINEDDLKV